MLGAVQKRPKQRLLTGEAFSATSLGHTQAAFSVLIGQHRGGGGGNTGPGGGEGDADYRAKQRRVRAGAIYRSFACRLRCIVLYDTSHGITVVHIDA